ncbi:hypothetical protein L1987_11044 [Smallanthus sonchifolius]|uniref:Uncharacterized protein n=1 Tax=Smallanthus sonchifolius TaxID=185202 RepID=A0ACB9JBX2_9ASTR|nr:hypothetical protein L1987_11044 [Smallanthus sonchifolius]
MQSSSFFHPLTPPGVPFSGRLRHDRSGFANVHKTVVTMFKKDGSSGKMVDENMIVLRERIRKMKCDGDDDWLTDNWMEWEKTYTYSGRYHSDVYKAVAVLQRFLIESRPSVALGLVALFAVGGGNIAVTPYFYANIPKENALKSLLHLISYGFNDEKFENDKFLQSNVSDPGQIARAIYDVEEATNVAFDIILEHKMFCRGSRDDTRGFSCGLWVLLHSLSVRVDDGESQLAFTATCDFIHKFFICEECSEHFYDMCSSIINWNHNEVFKFLVSYYGPMLVSRYKDHDSVIMSHVDIESNTGSEDLFDSRNAVAVPVGAAMGIAVASCLFGAMAYAKEKLELRFEIRARKSDEVAETNLLNSMAIYDD